MTGVSAIALAAVQNLQFTKTLDDVRGQVEADDTGKRDYRVRCEDISFAT